jgi:hypothetical protein
MEPDLRFCADFTDFADLILSSTNRRGTKATSSSNPVPHVKKGIESKSTDRRASRIL